MWTDWYVHHRQGNGVRVKIKSTSTAVHGQAGSVSQMVRVMYHEYETSKIGEIPAIRFSESAKNSNWFTLDKAWKVDEYAVALRDKAQTSLKDYIE